VAAALHLLLPGSLDDVTGGTRYDRHIVKGLRLAGWRVAVHGLDRSFPTPSAAVLAAADAVLSGLPDGALTVIDGLGFGAMPAQVARHGRRLRLVALVHHPLALETGLAAADIARLRASETAALGHARRVIVTSPHTARLLADYGVPAARIRVVVPGTDPAPAAQGSGSGGPLRLLCVGAVTPRKGHALLADALAPLRHLHWRLDCIGSVTRDAATVAAVQARIDALDLAGRVRLLGEVPADVLERHYAAADLFVLASHFEGYGMAYAEALARGLPVLGTTAGAIADTVSADAGLLVPPGSSAALREALAVLLTDAGLRRRLAAGAARARQSLPDWPTATARFAEALLDF
jgi:glycosyltransferase involved in cell wall biosynthesis